MPKMSGIETAFCRSALWGQITRAVILPWALQGQNISGDVLELGAGSGEMAVALLRQCPDIRLTLTDIDERMVTTARRRFQNSALQIEQSDSTALHFPDMSFDFVLSFLMLHHVVNWQSAVTEASRVLRPGGMLIGYDLTASPAARFVHFADRSPHRLLQPAELIPTARHAGLDISVRSGWARQIMRFLARKECGEGKQPA